MATGQCVNETAAGLDTEEAGSSLGGDRPNGLRRAVAILWIGSALALAGAHGTMPYAETAEDQSATIRLEWRVPTPQLAAVEQRLDFTGEQIPGRTTDRSSPLFVVLAGLVSLPSLAEAVASIYREVVYGGVVINACGNDLQIHNDHRLPGEVLVVRCGQDVGIYRSKDVAVSELVKALVDAGSKAKP